MATATRRKPAPTVPPFPSVWVGIYRGKKLLSVKQLDDPRNDYLRMFNSMDFGDNPKGRGLHAAPIPETTIPEMPGLHFRLGVFGPKTPGKVKYVGPKFQPCRLDARAMKLAMDRFLARKTKLSIGVFLEGGDA